MSLIISPTVFGRFERPFGRLERPFGQRVQCVRWLMWWHGSMWLMMPLVACLGLCMATYDFFLSHTQRDVNAKLLAREIYDNLVKLGKKCWLDVMMESRDVDAMKLGVLHSRCLIAIVTDNSVDSYFSREMCRRVCSPSPQIITSCRITSWLLNPFFSRCSGNRVGS